MNILSTSVRECTSDQMWSVIEPHLASVEITRVADITGLDRLGIPVYQAVRPTTSYPSTVFAGKGLSTSEAKVSACMEAIESFVTECYSPRIIRSDIGTLSDRGHPLISPQSLIIPRDVNAPAVIFDWVSVYKLTIHGGVPRVGDAFYVPKEAVLMPCPGRMWMCHTNGIASGSTLTEALIHAILEVVERDALSLALVSCSAQRVSPSYLREERINSVVSTIERTGLKLFLKDITSDLGIPTFYAVIQDPLMNSPWYCSSGAGAHVDPCIAVLRALTEAVQARACMISGSREDLHRESMKSRISYKELCDVFSFWFSDIEEGGKNFSRFVFDNLGDVLAFLLSGLEKCGYSVLWVDLSLESLPLKVVRVVIPGLECFSVDKARIGPRLIEREPKLKDMASVQERG